MHAEDMAEEFPVITGIVSVSSTLAMDCAEIATSSRDAVSSASVMASTESSSTGSSSLAMVVLCAIFHGPLTHAECNYCILQWCLRSRSGESALYPGAPKGGVSPLVA
jgi:hypothetical protein